MPIEELVKVVTPPAQPLEPGDEQRWKALEESLGLALPRDLFDFGMRYGTGYFGVRFLLVFNPFGSHYNDIVKDQLRIL